MRRCTVHRIKDQEDLKTVAEEMISLLQAGRIVTMITKQVGLPDVPQSLQDLETRRVVGKVVVNLSVMTT
jgi:NADPH:quinone reductase-like Zn-dependent oxidoreductase